MHFLSLYAFKSLFYGVTVSPTVIFRTPRIIGRQITSKKITGYYNSVASPGSEAVLSEYLMIHVSCMQSSFPYSSKDTNTVARLRIFRDINKDLKVGNSKPVLFFRSCYRPTG